MVDLSTVFSTSDFIPHGHCYLWRPTLVWLHLVSDSLIALAYYSIPVSLVYFARQRQDLPFRWVFWLFGAFIIACGTTHLLDVWTLWHPLYWLSGLAKLLTAVLSVSTAVLLYWLLPYALVLPSPAQWETANVQLREAQRIARLGYWDLDLRTQSVTWSESLWQLFGFSEAAATAPAYTAQEEFFETESWSQLQQAVEVAITDGTPYTLELQAKSLHGTVFWLMARGEAVRDATGSIVRLVGTVLDLTERKQIETKLQALNTLKDDFLNTVSHELRTPLTSLKMAVHLLSLHLEQCDPPLVAALGAPLAAKVSRYLGILQTECDRELTLVNELLELQRLESGVAALAWSSLHLEDWLSELVDAYQERASDRSQTLHLAVLETLPPVVTEVSLLDRVLRELLTNACKYTPPGGTINVVVTPTDRALRLSVSNTGPAIAPDVLPHLFEKFYRAPGGDPWQQGGTGLGLALVQGQVECLGGTITVTSDDIETVFQLVLPLKPVLG